MMRAGPRVPPESPHLTLYERKGCHLCAVALLQLRSLQQTIPFFIDRVDIEGAEDLERRFMLEIPVVEVAGEIVGRGTIDLEAVRVAIIGARLGNAGQLSPRDEG